ncbi:MAG: dienelactone hydrolase family protein [Desulfobacula sp.]|nr:dienelactone hydrolase family protein [Desulfobacula sp.]
MKTIIVSDIFGLTFDLKIFAENFSSEYEILDPYNGKELEFKFESKAYDHFYRVCGLSRYTDLVNQKISACNEKIFIIGFSVGACAVWNTLGSSEALIIKKAVCFYGSRIRENSNLIPCCDTVLVFPKKEKHFSVPNLTNLMAKTPNVQCMITEFGHGFMNKRSDNFDNKGYLKYLDWSKNNLA